MIDAEKMTRVGRRLRSLEATVAKIQEDLPGFTVSHNMNEQLLADPDGGAKEKEEVADA